jgi:hypothetical protein
MQPRRTGTWVARWARNGRCNERELGWRGRRGMDGVVRVNLSGAMSVNLGGAVSVELAGAR